MEEGLYLGDREKQWVLVNILPGNEVHHADGLAAASEEVRAYFVITTSPCWMGAVA